MPRRSSADANSSPLPKASDSPNAGSKQDPVARLLIPLRIQDQAVPECPLSALRPLWTAPAAESPDAAPTVTAAEKAAMARVPDLEGVARECAHPDRAAAALTWATITTPRSMIRISQSNYAVAPAVAVQLGGRRWALPPPLLLAGLQAAVTNLAS